MRLMLHNTPVSVFLTAAVKFVSDNAHHASSLKIHRVDTELNKMIHILKTKSSNQTSSHARLVNSARGCEDGVALTDDDVVDSISRRRVVHCH